jgi:hypothetical protein
MCSKWSGSKPWTSVVQENVLPMKPPCRVTRAPTLVGSPLGGSTDLAPPIHSGSRRGSNMTAATWSGLAAIVREAVTSTMSESDSRSAAANQPDRLDALGGISLH